MNWHGHGGEDQAKACEHSAGSTAAAGMQRLMAPCHVEVGGLYITRLGKLVIAFCQNAVILALECVWQRSSC